MIKTLLSAVALFWVAAVPLPAQSDIGTPATGEILSGWVRSDGSRMAAFKITLAPGWKTYWRSPGDAGIPPQFDWSRSTNLRGAEITWPAPRVFTQNGIRTIGYKDQLILPIAITPHHSGKPVTLRTKLDIGVCKDICLPYQLQLTATLDTPTTKPTPAIAAALAARPYSASEAGLRSATCTLRPNATGLEIETHLTLPPLGGHEVVVIEPGQPGLWMSETDTRRTGQQLVATGDLVPYGEGPVDLDHSGIVITVLGKNNAVEIKGCTPG